MSMNLVVIQGNVGKDPVVRKFESGGQVASFSVATTDRGYTKSDGTKVEDKTEWHNVIAFNGLAGIVEKYVTKGTPVLIKGSIHSREWTKDDGTIQRIVEIKADDIELLGRKPSGGEQAPVPTPPVPAPQKNVPTPKVVATPKPNKEVSSVSIDDLPF